MSDNSGFNFDGSFDREDYNIKLFNEDNGDKLSLDNEGYIHGINYYFYQPDSSGLLQTYRLLPTLRDKFPDAKGVVILTAVQEIGMIIDMQGETIINNSEPEPEMTFEERNWRVLVDAYFRSPMMDLPPLLQEYLEGMGIGPKEYYDMKLMRSDEIDKILYGWISRPRET